MSGILAGVVKFLGIVGALIVGVYTLSTMFLMPSASASEKPKWIFPEPPYVYFGLEYEYGDTFCLKPYTRSSDQLVSNGGFGQKIFKTQQFSIDLMYRHHSCAFVEDVNSYDSVGFTFKYSPWSK